ncbi:hypothetical protein LUZ61_014021 [Rhynchospora tenuis]|uniref:Uncharacterized protein n=1 Tax=Rhynchospora tenuis TaxID=198213 RepID=A0AAD5WAA4_9POAL|nr:hypothetical protein LUZ61_014021 [Rhynchospora tenuis]
MPYHTEQEFNALVPAPVSVLRREVYILRSEAHKKNLEAFWNADLEHVLDERTLQWVEDSMDVSYEIEDAVNDIDLAIFSRQIFISGTKKERRKWINEQKKKIQKLKDRIREIDDYGERFTPILSSKKREFGISLEFDDFNNPMTHRDGLMRYTNLSLGMKRCFLYFAAFPSDFHIEARSLFRIWVAERLIPFKETETETVTLEETAECFLEDLVQRQMVQVSHRFPDGSIKYCRINDVLRALAIEKSKEINFLVVCSKPDDWHIYDKAYRVAVHYSNDNELIDNYGSPNVRSLLLFGESSKVDCSKYKMLGVLANMRGEVKLESFRGSSHLRYLQLNTAFNDRDFGEWIGGMTNLETLDLRLSMHGDLSNWIWRVKRLRHVLLSEYYGETQGPTTNQTNLQTHGDLSSWMWRVKRLRHVLLSEYYGETQGPTTNPTKLLTLTGVNWNKSWERLSDVTNMRHLRELSIFSYREPRTAYGVVAGLFRPRHLKVQGAIDLAHITMGGGNFWNLKSLVLINDDYNSNYSLVLHDDMLPPSLTELELGFQFGSDPMPVLEKLERLNTLRIRGVRDIRNNPLRSIRCSAGGFKQLEELVLESLMLKEWKIEMGAMPELKRLSIRLCPLLRMPSELIHLGNLQHLTCTVIKTSLYFTNRDEIRNIFEQRPHLQGGLREVFGDFIPFDSF